MRFFRFRSMFESAVSPLGTRVGIHRELPRRAGGEGDGFSCRMEDGLEVIARVLPIKLQHLHPHSFHPHHFTHTYTLSLSLSHTHTHTHTHTLSLSLSLSLSHTHRHSGLPAATISPYHAKVSPCMLYSCQKCYSHLQKIDPIFFSHPETS